MIELVKKGEAQDLAWLGQPQGKAVWGGAGVQRNFEKQLNVRLAADVPFRQWTPSAQTLRRPQNDLRNI